jgi:hypothetical protein
VPTPPDPGQPHDGPALEPIRVLRPRRTDALAELIREFQEEKAGGYESVALPEPETQELPSVSDDGHAPPGGGSVGRVPGLRRTAVAGAVAAAAVVGFGCAFLLPGGKDDTAAPPSRPSATASAEPTPATPTTSAAADPDGAGTLREGDSGPEVTDLQERLLHIPDVYDHGSTSGQYDATLTAAVARFQLWYGIRGDENGVYGNDTRLALESRTGTGTG